MPTYEYECAACGHRLDHFQSIKDAPLRRCPKCKKLRLKRLISAGAGVIFKGSGFYTTDYRSSSYESAKKSDEAKPEPKSDSKSGTCGKPACDTGGCQSPPPAKKAKPKK